MENDQHPHDAETPSREWVQTYSGKCFYPFDPRHGDVAIEDIGHQLSMLCRYNGASTVFYSIAEHSVRLSQIVPPPLALAALLDDCAEVYMGPLTRPMKIMVPDWRIHEDRIRMVVFDVFKVPMDDRAAIRHFDDVMLASEREQIMNPCDQPWLKLPAPTKIGHITGWSPMYAEMRFLSRYGDLCRAAGIDVVYGAPKRHKPT